MCVLTFTIVEIALSVYSRGFSSYSMNPSAATLSSFKPQVTSTGTSLATRLTRSTPASSGFHGNNAVSQRGVREGSWTGVLVVLASLRADESLSATGDEESAMNRV